MKRDDIPVSIQLTSLSFFTWWLGSKSNVEMPSSNAHTLFKPLLLYLLMFYWPKHLRWPTNPRFQRLEELSFICWWEKWQCHIQRGVHIKWEGFMALKIYHSIHKNTFSQYRMLGCNTFFPLAHFYPSPIFWFALLLLSCQLIPIASFQIFFLCVLSFAVIWLGVNLLFVWFGLYWISFDSLFFHLFWKILSHCLPLPLLFLYFFF